MKSKLQINNVRRRLKNYEKTIPPKDDGAIPDIVINLNWDDERPSYTVGGVPMSKAEIDRRWPTWDQQPGEIEVLWGDGTTLQKEEK